MRRLSLAAFLTGLLLLSVGPVGFVSSEISVTTHSNSEGDWFTYEGYGLSLANSISKAHSSGKI